MVAPFPANPLGAKVELLLNGTWTDVSSYVYQRDAIAITSMGRPDESSTIQTSGLALTLNNRDGRFTPKNTAGAYYPYITRNVQIRVSVNSESANATTYSGYRYWGEVTEWPPQWDQSGKDVYCPITAAGVWRRISQAQATIGSAFYRYYENLTGTSIPIGYWPLEDGSGALTLVTGTSGASNASFTGQPSLGADSSFPGSDAIASLSGSTITATVPTGGTATNNCIRLLLSVPKGGDTGTVGTWDILQASTAGTFANLNLYLDTDGTLHLDGVNSGGTTLFTLTTTTNVQGKPVLVSVELTPSGSTVNYALRLIKPGGTSILESQTGSRTSSTIGAVSSCVLGRAGELADTAVGHLAVMYQVPSLTTAAYALNGYLGEFALDRFTRLCTENSLAYETIGTSSTSAALGPQVDDTLANLFQAIEDTDCGLLYEARDQFGLGYRTMASMLNQTAAATFSYTAGVLASDLQPVYDDQLTYNSWTVSDQNGYTVEALLTAGAMSVQAPPSGIGAGYTNTRSVCVAADSQVSAIANHLLNVSSVDQERYPVVNLDMSRSQVASLFATIPGLRIGDYFQITSPPSFLPSSTIKQLVWGYTETFGPFGIWTISFNAVPESPWETGFTPGTVQTAQVTGQPVTASSANEAAALASIIQNGMLSSSGLGNVITALAPSGVKVTTSATAPTSPNVGDVWINSTSGQLAQWNGTSWTYITFNATNVIQAGTIQAAQIAAGTIVGSLIAGGTITAGLLAAGIVVAGIVDATTISSATFQGTDFVINPTGAFFYSGTPAAGNLTESITRTSGADGFGNHYLAGMSSYSSSQATNQAPGSMNFYTGSLSAGWTQEVWHTIGTSLNNGWSGNIRLQYVPVGQGSVMIDVKLVPGTVADGTVIWTLGSTYAPSTFKRLAVGCDSLKTSPVNSSFLEAASLYIGATGQLQCYGVQSSASYFEGSGVYALGF